MISEPTIQYIEKIWPTISEVLHIPHNDADYDRLVEVLDYLIDHIGEDETHPLSSLMDVVGMLVSSYETGNPDLDWELRHQ